MINVIVKQFKDECLEDIPDVKGKLFQIFSVSSSTNNIREDVACVFVDGQLDLFGLTEFEICLDDGTNDSPS